MKKTFKIVGIVISIPVILFMVAAIVLATIDLNNYRSNIEQLVEENTGRHLTVKGDLEKSFFPWLGVNIGAVALSNASGFKPAEFASVNKVEIKIDAISLLTLKPKISRVIVKGLNLNLAKDKHGKTNWEDLSKKTPADGLQDKAPLTPDIEKEKVITDSAGRDPLALINIAGLTIEDANVNWVDDQAGASYAVKHVNLSVSEIALNKPVALDMDFELASNQPKVNAKVMLSTNKLDWDLKNQRYGVTPLTININANGDGLPVSPLSAKLQLAVAADLKQQTLNVEEMKLDTLGVSLQAKASVSQLMDAPQYHSTVEVAALNPKELMKKLSIDLPPMADKNGLSTLSVKTSVKGDTQQVKVSGLTVMLDDTKISADAGVKNFSKPVITASLSLDKMDLDRYLPPVVDEPETKAKAPEKVAPAAQQPLPIPVDLIRSLDVDASVKAGKLILRKLDIDDVVIKAQVKNSVATLSPVSLKVSGGSVQSDVVLDVKTSDPRYAVKQTIKQVQAAPLVTAVAGEEYVSGTLDLTAAANSQGMMLDQIKKNLNGSLSFKFENGAVKGVNLGEMVRKAKAKLDKEEYVESKEPRQTDFAQLSGTATIKNGVVLNNDLSAKSPLVRVEGKGQVNLVAENLDYLVTTYIVDTSKGQGGKSIEELKGIPIPIHLTGSFDNIQWDYKWSIIRDALQAQLKKKAKQKIETKKQEIKEETKQKIEEKKEEKKEELKEKAKEKLKKLFKF